MDSFTQSVAGVWGRPFSLSSLGGLVFAGATGLAAALSHVPGEDGRQRFAVFCFPHLGLGADGTVGPVDRRGMHRASTACGALMGFRAQLANGVRGNGVDVSGEDIEAELLAARLERLIPEGQVPSLLDVALLTREAAVSDIKRFIRTAHERSPELPVDVAYLSGIVVHLPDGTDGVAAVEGEVVIDGQVIPLPH